MGIEQVRGHLVAAVSLVTLLLPAVARADYSGTVDATTKVASLTGSGAVVITTSGGLLQHNALGGGFTSAQDFDSTQPGAQTVPDTGQWELDVTGGGQDSLEIDEGEPAGPMTFASGHTFVPGGTPCIVRDPNTRVGIDFSEHPLQETRFCYPSGINSVTVRAGSGNTEFDILDTEGGVPLFFFGGAGATQVSEAADVPTSVGGFHEPLSAVSYTAGTGPSTVALNDGDATTPATYTIGRNSIVKTGLEPLSFTGLRPSDLIQLYPQQGPSTIDIGPTGGVPVQIFGSFFGQTGPDHIDGSQADAPLIITGSLGADTIIGGPEPDYIDGAGGNDTITTTGGGVDQVMCAAGTASVANVDAQDMVTGCATVNVPPSVPALTGSKFKPGRVRHGRRLTLILSAPVSGSLTLSFKRASCKHARGCHRYVSAGTAKLALHNRTTRVSFPSRAKLHGRVRALPKGTYQVTARFRTAAFSETVTLPLVID
jgi:hypothetical protein